MAATRLGFVALTLPLAVSLLAGCATPFSEGVRAARAGRYADAAAWYEETLARDPDRLDALVSLGIARYKLGALDEAIDALDNARARAPREATVRLYLGLAYLQKGELGPADEHLTVFVDLKPDRRVAAQADRALKLMRGDFLSEETRAFVAASLEDEADLAREAGDARRALADAERASRLYPGTFLGPVCTLRGGRLRCF